MNTRHKEDVQKLFEYWCEIAPPTSGETVSGHIVSNFPEQFQDPEIIAKIPEFAYPCNFVNETVQTYSFVLTSTDSKWRFGFCRHDARSRTAMVLITYLPWHDTFTKFMNVLGELKKSDNGEFELFLAEAYAKGVPEPGASLKLFYKAGNSNFMFQRPSQFQLPSIPENHNLSLYYNFVEPINMIAIFAAMMAERRIVFTSHRLDTLSSCVQAANAFLYPMVWQHIFIPILPMKMKDILCAPMPYLIGVPDAVLLTMTSDELGDVVILNCDNRMMELQTPFDDVKSMPPELVSQLKKQFSNPAEHIGDRVSKIFLGILVQLIGGYRDAIKFTQGEKITWDRDTFVESRSPHLRVYLREMMELQIFRQFIEERLDMLNTGLGFSDEFELETLRHSEKLGRRGKHYKDFLKNVKDKTNPAVKSAVQSVKLGSRGVKTAYKDLRSKLRDKTPPHQFGGDGSGHMSRSQFAGYDDNDSFGMSGGHHRSAPNSPVFTKKQNQNDQSYNHQHHNYRSTTNHQNTKPHSMLQTSSSLMNNSNYTNHNNNNHISKSPTASQPGSNSSSEMNLLQELQQHALFKTPAVDRSLKPTHSLVYNTMRPLRSGSLVNTPKHPSASHKAPDALSLGALCMFDEEEARPYNKLLRNQPKAAQPSDESLNSSSRNSSFDSPPEMPSPPVPPRSLNPPPVSSKSSPPASTSSSLLFMLSSSPPPPPIATHGHAKPSSTCVDSVTAENIITTITAAAERLSAPPFENNFVNNDLFSSIAPTSDHGVAAAPLIPLRQSCNSEASAAATTPNLIQLESNTSFELEDFDPLNQNARQIPMAATRILNAPMAAKSSMSPSNMASTYQPVYPSYLAPKHQQSQIPPTAPPRRRETEDDVELLRKYGLDQFSLTDGAAAGSSHNSSSTPRSSRDRTNWTVFE